MARKPKTFDDLPYEEQVSLVKDDPSVERDWRQSEYDLAGFEAGGQADIAGQQAQAELERREKALQILREKSRAEIRAIATGTRPGEAINPARSPNSVLDLQKLTSEHGSGGFLSPQEEAAFAQQATRETQNKLVPLIRQRSGYERPGFVKPYTTETFTDKIRGAYDQNKIPVDMLPEDVRGALPKSLGDSYLDPNKISPDERGLLRLKLREQMEKLIDEQGAVYQLGSKEYGA